MAAMLGALESMVAALVADGVYVGGGAVVLLLVVIVVILLLRGR